MHALQRFVWNVHILCQQDFRNFDPLPLGVGYTELGLQISNTIFSSIPLYVRNINQSTISKKTKSKKSCNDLVESTDIW